MRKIILNFLFFIPYFFTGQNLQLSPQAEISIITCGPGEELYSSFGHSAFRVKDPSLNIDIAYNYGTFDFNTPNFYGKFAQGKLLYHLSVYSFKVFEYSYLQEQRWVKEQVLNLTREEKNKLFHFLNNNAKPENKFYLYDFFFDNCSSKIRDVLVNVLDNNLKFNNNYIKDSYTFRELIQMNLNPNSWGSFGIDLALGSVIDRNATPYEYMFLPDFIFSAFEHAKIKDSNQPVVKKTNTILKSNKNFKIQPYFLLSPGFVYLILFLLVFFVTYTDIKNNKRSRWLDFSLFFFTGVIGIIVLLLWFATDHTMTKNNFNFLWAFPLNIVVSFFTIKKELKNWTWYYLIALLSFILITIFLWIFKIQVFPLMIIPVLLMLTIRYLYLLKYSGNKKHIVVTS
ncbi:lipoprotein N-acyltransferase Lnb domain-containing protein [Abyssalbus ytuae]|uniref:DUF4105 domain-containing protein n=1 Tax=Abyssalbus ytuae TaxID=2926907 RepID=A0A9E6ZMW7_9FLAO|nr:DUF4105 domain-containing protein [Abyssalbus ytuae]UOB17205.1 DUF4105 domain-containing protein [Abyssalbus ytuae]